MCDSCEAVRINGTLCHEQGCPDSHKGTTKDCSWCGQEFEPKDRYDKTCSHSCSAAYWHTECDCEECNPIEDSNTDDNNRMPEFNVDIDGFVTDCPDGSGDAVYKSDIIAAFPTLEELIDVVESKDIRINSDVAHAVIVVMKHIASKLNIEPKG